MNGDLIMVLGIIVFAAAIPATISAFSHGNPPRSAMIAVIVGGSMIVGANLSRPGGYRFDEIPQIFVRVIEGFFV